jgi:hypothetical protein
MNIKLRNRPERDALERLRYFTEVAKDLVFYNGETEAGWMHPILPTERDRIFIEARVPPHIFAALEQFELVCRRHKYFIDDGVDKNIIKLRGSAKFVETTRSQLVVALDRREALLIQDEQG